MAAATLAAEQRSRLSHLAAPLAVAGSVSVAVAALRLRDPHASGAWGTCPFKALTGWDCPGCGALRAVNDLTHGEVLAAAHSNALLVLAAPVLISLWLLWVRRSWSPDAVVVAVRRRTAWHRLAPFAFVLLVLGFAVVRNTGWGSGLHVS